MGVGRHRHRPPPPHPRRLGPSLRLPRDRARLLPAWVAARSRQGSQIRNPGGRCRFPERGPHSRPPSPCPTPGRGEKFPPSVAERFNRSLYEEGETSTRTVGFCRRRGPSAVRDQFQRARPLPFLEPPSSPLTEQGKEPGTRPARSRRSQGRTEPEGRWSRSPGWRHLPVSWSRAERLRPLPPMETSPDRFDPRYPQTSGRALWPLALEFGAAVPSTPRQLIAGPEPGNWRRRLGTDRASR